jgi:MFS family permease
MINSETTIPNTPTNNTVYADTRYGWYLVVLLTVTYSLAVIDRVSLGLLVGPIQADLGLSDTQFGMLHGLAFVLFFAIAGFPLGMAVDRWSRKKILLLGSLVLSLATFGSAFAGTFILLFIARILVGAGDSAISPSSSALIADNFPPERRARAYGVYASGIAIGSGAAFALSAYLLTLAEQLQTDNVLFFADMKIWQVVFFIMAIPGLIMSIVIFFTVKEPVKRSVKQDSTSTTDQNTLKEFFAYVKIKKSAYVGIIAGVAIIYIAGNSYFSWYVAYLIREFSWTAQEAGGAIGAITVPIGLFSAISSGWVTSWFYKRQKQDAPLRTILIMAVTSSSFLFAAAVAPSAVMSLTFFALSAFTVNWGFPSALTALNNITPPQFRGQVTALFAMALGIIAIGLGPVIVGALSDLLFGGPEHLGDSLALVSVVCGVVGFTLIQRCRKHYLQHIVTE